MNVDRYRFRGKSVITGEWVYGFYAQRADTTYCFKEDYENDIVPINHYILVEEMIDWGLPNHFREIKVDPNTVCMAVRRNKYDDSFIYEDDIVECAFFGIDVVTVDDMAGDGYESWDVRVLGNIHDNPDLIHTNKNNM